MVFSSVPLYLDPPNWQQHPNQQQQLQAHIHNNINHHEQNQGNFMTQQPPPQAQQLDIGGGIVAQQNRANSMSERARIAKIPPPEIPLKCPRCDSSNTKFCYYNNYSLTQPRHFCKTCRRYWTRGGALRNVPVGGGCRRNKRTSSKSSSAGTAALIKSSTLSSVSSPSTLVNGERTTLHHNSILEQLGNDPRGINVNLMSGVGNNSSMSFMASLQSMAQLGGVSSNMGLFPFSGGSIHNLNSQSTPPGLGAGSGSGNGSNNSSYQQNLEYPQQQIQFPNFLGGFEIPSSFQSVRHLNNNNQDQEQQQQHHHHQQELNGNSNMSKISGSSLTSAVKMEGNTQQGLNLPKQLMMGSSNSTSIDNNNQFWDGSNTVSVTTMWTDLSGLNSSSTSHLV